MAWNGSGTFSRTNGVNSGSATWADDKAGGAKILASRHDTHDQDVATGLSLCLTEDGQNVPTAHLNWVDTNRYVSALGGSSGNYTATLSPAATAYYGGMVVRGVANHTNTGAATLNVNGLGAKNIYRLTGQAVAANEIINGYLYEFVYDGTQFIIVNHQQPIPIGPFFRTNKGALTSGLTETMSLDYNSGSSISVQSVFVPGNRMAVGMSFALSPGVTLSTGTVQLTLLEGGSSTSKVITATSGNGKFATITPEALADGGSGVEVGINLLTTAGWSASGPTIIAAWVWLI